MKIKLNYIHVNNYGNLMMASVFIDNFFEMHKDKNIEFYTDITSEKELNRLKDALKTKPTLYLKRTQDVPANINVFKKILLRLNSIIEEVRDNNDYDMVIYLGGDAISEYYSKIGFVEEAVKIWTTSRKKAVYLVGQTLGPFTSYRKLLAKKALKNCKIYTRDDNCLDYMVNSLKLDCGVKSRDLAFLNLAHQDSEELLLNITKKYDLNDEYITFVASGLHVCYTDDFNAYVESNIKILKAILDNYNYKVVLLAHVIHNKISNDKVVIDEMVKRLKAENYDLSRVTVITDLLQPVEARRILGNGKLTLTGRMHAAVSTLAMGVPAISLSYSVKYEGVIGKGLNLEELIIESANDTIWQNGEVVNLAMNKIKYVLENYDKLEEKIKIQTEKAKELSLFQIKDIKIG